METELLVILMFIGLFVLVVRSFMGVNPNKGPAKDILSNPDHKWTDSVRAWGGEMHFDTANRRIALIPRSGKAKVVGFGDVRRWNYGPLYNAAQTSQLGYRFQVTTNDGADPITFLDIRGMNHVVPEMWMAKLNAYING